MDPAGVYPLREAARHVGMRESVARNWMRKAGLARTVEGREVVIWGDVLDALRGAPVQQAAERKPVSTPRRRAAL